MDDSQTHPYTLEVMPCARKPGMFEWAIRRSGKLIQRSDRLQRTEDDARKDGVKAIEREYFGARSAR